MPDPKIGSDAARFAIRDRAAPTVARAAAVILILVLLVGVPFVIVSPALAEHLLFYPDRRDPGAPPVLASVAGERVELETSDGVGIFGWWYGPPDASAAVLLLHGNAGNVAGRTVLAEGLVAREIGVFLLEYRGYGGNPGEPSIEGTIRDAEAGLDFVARRAGGEERTVLFGRSLGGAVGMQALEGRRVGAVILESTFTSLEAMARSVYPWLPGLLFRRLRGLLDTRSAVARLDAPLLVVHGSRDDLVPAEMGRQLLEAGPGPREWYEVPGAGHNDVFVVGGAAYFDRLARFLERWPPEEG